MMLFHNHCRYTPGVGAHKIYHRSVSWNVARRTCEEDGAYLVIINSVAEAEAVVRLFDKSYEWGVSVGLHDLYQEEEFVTIHGEPSVNTGFDVWVPGSPNNAGNNENCVSLKPSKKLDDVSCSNRRPFVCELHEDQCNMQMAQVSR